MLCAFVHQGGMEKDFSLQYLVMEEVGIPKKWFDGKKKSSEKQWKTLRIQL